MIRLVAVCFSVCLFMFTPSLTFAQKGKSPPVTKVNSPKTKHADRNADGVVTKKEMRIEKKKDDRFVNKDWEKKADANQDGIVDNKESGLWKEKHPLPPDWKKRLDLNNDGTVNEEELRLWKRKQIDSNNDGIVSEEELVLWKREHQGTEEPE